MDLKVKSSVILGSTMLVGILAGALGARMFRGPGGCIFPVHSDRVHGEPFRGGLPGRGYHRPPVGMPNLGGRLLERLDGLLSLSETQEAKVRDVLKRHEAEMDSIHRDVAARMAGSVQRMFREIRPFLDAEQIKLLAEEERQLLSHGKRDGKMERRGKRGGLLRSDQPPGRMGRPGRYRGR